MDYSLCAPVPVSYHDAPYHQKYGYAQVHPQVHPAYYSAGPPPYPSILLQQYNAVSYAQSAPEPQNHHMHLPEGYPVQPYNYEMHQPAHQIYTQVAVANPPIHAPIPVSAYSTLLSALHHHTPTPQPHPEPAMDHSSSMYAPSDNSFTAPTEDAQSYNPVDHYTNAPQTTFPTPCDLLVTIQGQPRALQQGAQLAQDDGSSHESSAPSSPCTSRSAGDTEPEEPLFTQDGPATASQRPIKKPENQRKAHFRSVADKVGFQATDPDTLTSHEKKRHYLASMEQFVLNLHEHFRLVAVEPLPLKRFTAYTGLDTRSIRTLLVHNQNECRDLHSQVLDEERKYLELERLVLDAEKNDEELVVDEAQEAPPTTTVTPVDARRHSIASGMIAMNDAWHTAPGPDLAHTGT